MIRVFADTSFLVATIDPRDQHSITARRAFSELIEPQIHTAEEVLAEVLTFCSANRHTRRDAAKAVRHFLNNPNIIVHRQSSRSFQSTLEFYESRTDKGYSYVDCRGMAIMKDQDISLVLTNDHHFAQEGFTLLF